MAGKRDTPIKGEMAVQVRLGAPILETGYTLVPNLLLDHYETLGLTDCTAIFVIRLLGQGASHRGALSDSPQTRDHLKTLQDQGLISVQRWPDGIQVHLDALFHNLVRLADWLAEGHSPDDFKPEVPTEMLGGDEFETTRFDSAEFEAEMTDVLAAFAAANQRAASPAEKEQIHNLAMRFDAAAHAAVEPSNGPAWVMAALRSALEQKSSDEISVLDLERALESRMSTDGTTASAAKAIRREVSARVQKMGTQEKEALGTVLMAYRGVAGHPPNDRLVLTLMQWSDEYGLTWVLNAIHEAGKVQQLISPEYVESILMRWRSEGRIPGAPVAAKSPPLTDPLLVRVVALYEQEVDKLTPQTQAQLLALTQEFRDVNEWARAFAEAAKSNARSLRYVEAVLRKKGKKPAPASRRSIGSHRRRGAVRESTWTEEELEAARREALSEAPIDVESFLGEEA